MSEAVRLSPEQIQNINARLLAGEEVSKEEIAQAVRTLVADRFEIAKAKPKGTSTKIPVASLDDLL